MTSPRRRERGFAIVALAALGCSAARPPPPTAHVVAGPDVAASYTSPARWDYHPVPPTTALAAQRLPGGECVFTAEGGQRWRSSGSRLLGSRLVCTGDANASLAVAPEELTAITRLTRTADASWLFVGEGGTLYETAAPLAPFQSVVPAPEPLAKVTSAGAGVLAATQDGELLRWDAALGWTPLAKAAGLDGVHVFDLAAGGEGRVLALGFPEALFVSEDFGASFHPVRAEAVGARRLGRTGTGELGAQGLLASMVWRGATFARTNEKLQSPAATLAVDVGRGASASAVAQARAVIDGDRYYEVVKPDTEGEPWLLARGRIEGRLETTTLADSGRCANLRLGAHGAVVLLACIRTEGADISAEIRRSTDSGATFGAPLALVTPDTEQVTLAVSSDGAALVTGVCRPSEPSATCKPMAPFLLVVSREPGAGDGGDAHATRAIDGGGAALRALPASAPQLAGLAQGPVWSPDGRSAYFLGKRGKDERVTVFVSHDRGTTFAPRALQLASQPRAARHRDDDDDTAEPDDPLDAIQLDDAAIHPGEDGTLGLVATRWRGNSSFAYVTADEDGRVLQVSNPPLDDDGSFVDVILAGFGRRVLAVPAYLGGDTSGPLWESLDGGATWDRQVMPTALAREYARNNMGLACSAAGCIVADALTRVGWGSSGELAPASAAQDAPSDPNHHVRTPLVCEISPSSAWTRIDNAVPADGATTLHPGLGELMRGRSVWSVLVEDGASGAVGVVTAQLSERGEGEARVVRRPLLGAASKSSATFVSTAQAEGYAAIRAEVPLDARGRPATGSALKNLELAWEDLAEGTSGRARVPVAGAVEGGDVTTSSAGAVLHPELVALRSRGLFVRPHAARGAHGSPAIELFADGAHAPWVYERATLVPASPLGAIDLRADAAVADGELVDVQMTLDEQRAWSILVAAKRATAGASARSIVTALALLPDRTASPLVATTAWSSLQRTSGVVALVADPLRARAWAHFVAVRPDGGLGPPRAIATLHDLGERPRPCSAAERAASPRAAMPLKANGAVLFPGTRHPVLVFEPRVKSAAGAGEPSVLLTTGAVVHGSPASPCVGAFHAESAGRAGLSAVIPGDPARSWLFRTTDGPPPGEKKRADAKGPALEYRPMTCHYDPNAAVPDVVWSQDGTSRP